MNMKTKTQIYKIVILKVYLIQTILAIAFNQLNTISKMRSILI